MAYEQIKGPFDPLGQDEPREVERKLNSNGAQLAAQFPGVPWTPVRLTVASGDGGLDTAYEVQTKLNRLYAAVATATSSPAPEPINLSAVAPSQPTLFGGPPAPTAVSLVSALMQHSVVSAINKQTNKAATSTVPVPNPAVTSLPSISPASGLATATYTGTNAVVTNGTVTARRWLLGAAAIGTGATVVPGTAGQLKLENTVTGINGTVIVSTSNAITVT